MIFLCLRLIHSSRLGSHLPVRCPFQAGDRAAVEPLGTVTLWGPAAARLRLESAAAGHKGFVGTGS